MQEQCAPPRFAGYYPHAIKIPMSELPHDKFVQHALRESCINGKLSHVGDCVIGNFPKLIMVVKDHELSALAGDLLENFDDIDCQNIKCTCDDKFRYMQLFAHTDADRDSILYNDCKRTIFAAAKRQIKSAPVPDAQVAKQFVDWSKAKIDELVGEELHQFGYSYNQWYNHLTLAKQKRMDAIHEFIHGTDPLKEHFVSVEKTDPRMFHYEAICKVEVQGIDGKPRMVCAIPDLVKYVMGPVCWKLEELFSEKIPSYCGGQNLSQMQDKINHYIDEGFCVVAEGDGSAFDNTQDVLLKGIDRYIYSLIEDSIHHVPRELFRYVSQACYKVMDVMLTEGKKKRNLLSYAVLGTVFSGDCDTTLMNTTRMGFYNWFTNEKAHLGFRIDFICFSKGDDFTNMYKACVDIGVVKRAYKMLWLGKPDPNGPAYTGLDDRVYGLGQILKFIEFGSPNAIKFCSLRAWYTNYHTQHIFLTRDPAKFLTLSKYSRRALHMRNVNLIQYCLDQAIAIRSSYAGVEYFEQMAKAYVHCAQRYAHGIDLQQFAPKMRDRRITLPLEEELFDGYSYAPRKMAIRIEGTYWETMQNIERVHTSSLTEEELRTVNAQINEEFSGSPIWLLEAGIPY